MTGVINHTARQYNLKGKVGDKIVVVRLKPGFNVVDDEEWGAVSKIKFTKNLKDSGRIDFGKKSLDDKELDAEKSEIAETKVTKATGNEKPDGDE